MLLITGTAQNHYMQKDMKGNMSRMIQILSESEGQRSSLVDVKDKSDTTTPPAIGSTVTMRVSASSFKDKVYFTAYEYMKGLPHETSKNTSSTSKESTAKF